MKLGIIGSGAIVEEFLPMMQEVAGIELWTIQGTIRSKEKVKNLCETYDIPNGVFSVEELLQTGVEAVYIATPNVLHYEMAKQVLEAGVSAIVEKPITSHIGELKELQKIAEAKGCFLLEAITTLHFAAYKKIQSYLTEIGEVKQVICNFSQYSRRYDRFKKGEILPVFDPEKAGGALMDLNLYNVHFVMGLFGMPKKSAYYANVEKGIDTSGTLFLQYDGFQATCTAAKSCSGPFYFVIEGTEGYITVSHSPNVLGCVTLHHSDGREAFFEEPYSAKRCIPEFQEFVRILEEKDEKAGKVLTEKTEQVLQVLTEARMQAGITFPMDKNYQ